ncbi:MAG: GTPase HflX [Bacillota bacterium]
MSKRERAILVGLDTGQNSEDTERAMAELALLTDTAGAEAVDTIIQKRNTPDRAYYIGRGKVEELTALVEMLDANMVIFNKELSPSQIRNLDNSLGVRVVDRTALILDIFARRALSREGKLQVELAQMQYLLPRLIGLGNQLSRLGGGIGTRGPGETQLEIDRRVIRRRISDLKKEIAQLRKQRSLHRERRKRNRFDIISLVGYTNAGKSTLLNTLTGSDLYTEDKLFATLDPMVRRGTINSGKEVLFTDTVGFIEQLPRQLVTAFQATLEEISAADLLLHVVDINHPDHLNQIKIVREHLSKIDAEYSHRELLVFNKVDLAKEETSRAYLEREFPRAAFISAKTGEGAEALKEIIAAILIKQRYRIKIYLPYNEGKLLSEIQDRGDLESIEYRENQVVIKAVVDKELADRLEPFISDDISTRQ